MKKIPGGATNYEKFSATVVDRRRKFLISNRLKWLEELNICLKWLEELNANFHHKEVFIKKLFRVNSQCLQIFKVFGVFKFKFEVLNFVKYKS